MIPCYVTTDVEVDGPVPGQNSMLSFASVAIDAQGGKLDDFEATIRPLPGAATDPPTLIWFRRHPEAFAAATTAAQPATHVIKPYVDWVRSLPDQPIFVAHPLALDAP